MALAYSDAKRDAGKAAAKKSHIPVFTPKIASSAF